jgi:hypothetical protein
VPPQHIALDLPMIRRHFEDAEQILGPVKAARSATA